MAAEPIWIRADVVRAIHLRQLAEHGGDAGIRDEGLLEFALARPKNLLAYSDPPPDIPALAASYAYGIARNHPFIEGNKRTAFVVCRTFMILNSRDIKASQEDKYVTFLKLAQGDLAEDALTHWLRDHQVNRPDPEDTS